jgi:hypothetical protein
VSASSPRAAVEELLSVGVLPSPRGPISVTRGRITLQPLDAPPALRPERLVEREQVMIEGPPFTVDRDTVRFLKEREILGRHLFAVSFEATTNPVLGGRRHELGQVIVALQTEAGRWQARRACGLAGSTPPPFDRPYVALGVQWNRDEGLYGSARVYRGDAHVTSVRLRFPDGARAEADSEHDIALFLVEHPHGEPPATAPSMPETIELLDDGRVIATQPANQFPTRFPPASRPPSP